MPQIRHPAPLRAKTPTDSLFHSQASHSRPVTRTAQPTEPLPYLPTQNLKISFVSIPLSPREKKKQVCNTLYENDSFAKKKNSLFKNHPQHLLHVPGVPAPRDGRQPIGRQPQVLGGQHHVRLPRTVARLGLGLG